MAYNNKFSDLSDEAKLKAYNVCAAEAGFPKASTVDSIDDETVGEWLTSDYYDDKGNYDESVY